MSELGLAFLAALIIASAFTGAICWLADRTPRSTYDRWGKK